MEASRTSRSIILGRTRRRHGRIRWAFRRGLASARSDGSTTRSGAAVDATSGAFLPPPEIAAVRTPVRGVATTHRVMIALNPAGSPVAGWSATPRAAAEPLVDAFVGRLLPLPARVGIRARYLQNNAFVNVER